MKNIFILLLFCACSLAGFSQDTRTQNVKTLLEVSGSAKMGVQVAELMMKDLKKSLPDVPEEFWTGLMKDFNAMKIIELITPVYLKYYSDDEIIQLIAFYNTPMGKKLVEKTPLIMQETYVIGQKWGEEIGKDWISKLKEKGYIK